MSAPWHDFSPIMASEYAIDLAAANGMTNLFFIASFYLGHAHYLSSFCFLDSALILLSSAVYLYIPIA